MKSFRSKMLESPIPNRNTLFGGLEDWKIQIVDSEALGDLLNPGECFRMRDLPV
jgi:hypothetical protein